MITVDISNVWGELSLTDLLRVEAELSAAHAAVAGGGGLGGANMGWLELPVSRPGAEHFRIMAAAARIRETSDTLVVIGSGGAVQGARAAIELLQGQNRNMGRGKGDPVILFAGDTLSTRAWNELTKQLEGRDFSLCVVSRSGTTLESAVAFRSLKWMLERRFGTAEARRRIWAVTDPEKGPLRQLAREEGWECFDFPEGVEGCCGVLSAAGLLPMAAAGIDIMSVLRGACDARQPMDLRSFENPVWLYSAIRVLMHRSGKAIELLAGSEPGIRTLGRWWQQLFSGAGSGIFPVCAELTGDLYALGQPILRGQRNLFETTLRFDPPRRRLGIVHDFRDLDGLNCVAGRELDQVEDQAWQNAIAAHSDSGCPVISIDCGALDEAGLGELFWFFQLCCCITAQVLGEDPFDLPGTRQCRRELDVLLGRPE